MRLFIIVAVAAALSACQAGKHSAARPQPPADASAWCDSAHTVRYIDAAHCAGLSSCDRMFLSSGRAVPCPKS
jgi:hypothetical protein